MTVSTRRFFSGTNMELLSLQVGLPQTLGRADADDPLDQEWTTGFLKQPVTGAVWLGHINLVGDGQADLKHHGGPDKAINAYPAEHYPFWEQSLHVANLPPGAFGENFTTLGLLESDVCIGDVFEIGGARIQISQPRQPCWKLARRWRQKDLALQLQQTGRTGWYFRVLREGEVASGNRLQLVDRPHPEWTVSAANDVMHHRQQDRSAAQALAACQSLSASWRETLLRRVATGDAADTSARLHGANG
jgi:MOSC domain-containing protein YiiM